MRKSNDRRSSGFSLGKVIIRILLVLVAAVVLLFAVLMVTEYKPMDRETIAPVNSGEVKTVSAGQSLKVMTWNVGYGALGDNADFFMDGGSHVMTATKERLFINVENIGDEIESVNPDVLFLQEVDRSSTRSHYVDETTLLINAYCRPDGAYSESFAPNFKTLFIPYPFPPMGKVDSGIMTLSRYRAESAERVALPCPFSWPVSMVNLKRCLDVTRMPIEGSDHELVLINLHLEAYDDGEGKIAQTKMLSEYMAAEAAAGNYVIAGGDFNQVFSSVDNSMYPTMEGKWQAGELPVDEFEDGFHFWMDNRVPTCRSLDQPIATAESRNPDKFQYYMLDGFIVSNNVQVDSLDTIDLGFANSDHNPVVMNITLQ